MDNPVWPTTVQNLTWPEDGLTYSYENRGYIKPEKVGRWLSKAFGEGNGKYAVYNRRIYIKAPREPTKAELRWMKDPAKSSGVEVEEYGWLTME